MGGARPPARGTGGRDRAAGRYGSIGHLRHHPMSPMRRLLCLALLACTAPALAAEPVTLHCERLFDARAGRMLGAHTITVEDGRIRTVQPGRIAPADGGRAIDLSGRSDLNANVGSQAGPQSYSEGFRLDPVDYALRAVGYAGKTLRAGFTSVRDLGGEVAPHLRDAINQGLVEGPRIFAAGKSIAT